MDSTSPWRNVLVGVDPDGLARHAIARGADLAARLDARLHLIQAVEVPPPLWLGLDEQDLVEMHASALTRARQASLQRLAPALAPLLRDVGRELDLADRLRVYPGRPGEVLLDHAQEHEHPLFVLGPHAKRALFDFGSTARAVLGGTKAAVWIQGEPLVAIETILVAVELSDGDHIVLERALALAQRLGARLRVLHAFTPAAYAYVGVPEAVPALPADIVEHERATHRDALEKLVRELDRGSVAVESRLAESRAEDAILEAAEEADLVVVGTHGRKGLARFVLGSVAYGVLKQATKPVLAIPNRG